MNPNIALSLRGVQVRDPSEAYQKALTLKSLMGQQEMQGMQLQQARDKMAEDDAIKQAGIDSGGDPNLTIKALMSKGYYGPAKQLQKMYGESEKHRYDALKSRGEVSELQRKLQAQHASAILSATPENVAAVWQATRQQAIEAGIPGAERSPPEWDERMRPQIEADQMQGLNTKDALAEIASRPSVPSTVQALTSGPTPIASEDVGMQPQDFGKFTVPEGAKTMADVVPYLTRDQELAAAEGQVVAYPGADGRLNLGSPQVAAERQTALTTGKINAPPAEAEAQKPAITAEGLRKQANELEALGGVARLERAHKLRQDANALEGRDLEMQRLEQSKKANEESQKNRELQQTNSNRQNTLKLSDDFRQEQAVKSYRTVAPLSAVMQEAVTRNTAGADVNLVYIVSKVFDPDSVVRDQERVVVVNAGGLPGVVQNALGFVTAGQRIPDEMRKQLLAEVQSRFGAYKQAYDQISSQYKDTAGRLGVDYRDVIRHVDIKPETPVKAIGTDRRKSSTIPDTKEKYPTDFSKLWKE